jgi:hypothetical protein
LGYVNGLLIRRTIYEPEGVLAIVGGHYVPPVEPVGGDWTQDNSTAYDDYSLPAQREDAFKRMM